MIPTMINEVTTLDEAICWQAVQDRDASYNDTFVFAVRSTHVYCLPSCPSRRPRREQVAFYSTWEAAEMAGFRPCRRCRPREALAPDLQTEAVRRACAMIEANPETPPSLAELGRKLGFSPSHLQRLFKAATGLTPRQYAAGQRIARFKSMVRSGDDVTTALYNAGYGSTSRLYEGVSARLGMTPAAYRKGGQGMDIHYTIVDTRLGRMLVAATAKGVCAVSFGEDDARLEAFLEAEYPSASRERDDAAIQPWVNALNEHLEGRRPNLALPLDVQATVFQMRVWEELRRIPSGQTRTYTEVAEAIGKPSAVRAVASACAANPASVVTPCHRVLRRDGGLGGYRWGLERKKALLEIERD